MDDGHGYRTPTNKKEDRSGIVGLRQFSQAVMHKVEEKGKTTYNEVAEELLEEMKESIEEKEHKNIRRRVYDALNVLLVCNDISCIISRHWR